MLLREPHHLRHLGFRDLVGEDADHGNALGDIMRQELLQALLAAQGDDEVGDGRGLVHRSRCVWLLTATPMQIPRRASPSCQGCRNR